MRIILETEERIRLVADSDGFGFEAEGDAGLSPFHLLAASLATCTYSVVHSWAHHAGLAMDGLAIVVEWELGGDPVRVSDVRMDLEWPALPPSRREAARRVAAQCTIHHTLEHGSRVQTEVSAAER
jgi:uncharacterized OsmC-like protein